MSQYVDCSLADLGWAQVLALFCTVDWLGLTLPFRMGSNTVHLCLFWDSGRKDNGYSAHVFPMLHAKDTKVQAKPHRNMKVLCSPLRPHTFDVQNGSHVQVLHWWGGAMYSAHSGRILHS